MSTPSIRELLAKVARLERQTWIEAIADFFRAQQDCLPTLEGESADGAYFAEWPKLEGEWDELPELHVNHVGPALGNRAGGKVWWRFVTGGMDAADAYTWPAAPTLRDFRWCPISDGVGGLSLVALDERPIAQGVEDVRVYRIPAGFEAGWWKWTVTADVASTTSRQSFAGDFHAREAVLGVLSISPTQVKGQLEVP